MTLPRITFVAHQYNDATALLCEQLIAHPASRSASDGSARLLKRVRDEYTRAWRINFSRRLVVAAAFAHSFMRPISTRIAATLLEVFPKLLTEGARWTGKADPLRGTRLFDGVTS